MNPSDALREALEEARRTIKANRAVMMMRQGASVEQDWEIYERCSPEMRKIDAALAAPVIEGEVERVARAIEAPFLPHGYELKPHLLKSAARNAIAALRSQVVGVK